MYVRSPNARSRAFDEIVGSVAETLSNARVVAKLGGVAAQLSAVLPRVFLPNVRTTAQVPRNCQNSIIDVPLLPVTDAEMDNMQTFAGRFLLPRGPYLTLPRTVYSTAHEKVIDVERELTAMKAYSKYRQSSPRSADKASNSDRIKAVMIAGYASGILRYPNGPPDHVYQRSMPVVFCRLSALQKEGAAVAGLLVLHELTHVVHLLAREGNNGQGTAPLLTTLPFAAQTESLAYTVSGDAAAVLGITGMVADSAAEVAALRAEYAYPDRPERVTLPFIEGMLSAGHVGG